MYEELSELFRHGKYLTAWNQVESQGGLNVLEGLRGRVFAGRLAGSLGAERLGRAIHLRAWRSDPTFPELLPYIGFHLIALRGPVAALEFLQASDSKSLKASVQADHLSAKALSYGLLRDFERAYAALDKAFEIDSELPWLHVIRAHVLEAEDRHVESLASLYTALEIQPHYRQAVLAASNALSQQDRVDEAKSLLLDASAGLECGDILAELAALELDSGEYHRAREHLTTARQFYPLLDCDRKRKQWYLARCADAAYHCGDIETAISMARESKSPFHQTVANHLERNRDTGRRVTLDVGFTLQHYDTCAPATVSTLTTYWGRPFEHLEIVDAICYDGTPAHAEREWLQKHDFCCREFTVTWDNAIQLIDQGIPFALTTVGLSMGHMQAVIGYDSFRGVLIVRDPNVRHSTECLGRELIENMRSTGPRGLAFAPSHEAGRLKAIQLTDADHYDDHFDLTIRLENHDRQNAVRAYRRMFQRDRDHRLTTYARARIASYDADHGKLLRCTNSLLKRFPTDANQLLIKLKLLRENGTRAERLALLHRICEIPGCETLFQEQYASELMIDRRGRHDAARLLRRCLHRNPLEATTMATLANLYWVQGERSRAVELLRFATCLKDKDEGHALAYFSAARTLHGRNDALRMLRDRFRRFGRRSSGPAQTLVEAYDQLHKTPKSLEVLRKALQARPKDGELKTFAANFYARIGRLDAAWDLLQGAKGICHPSSWLRVAADLARRRGRSEKALELLHEALKVDPLDLELHAAAIELLADTKGWSAAVEHLMSFAERFPDNYVLRTQLVHTIAQHDILRAIDELKEMVRTYPEDSWAWRELGLRLIEERRCKEALAAAKSAIKLDSSAAASHYVAGLSYQGLGARDKARRAFHRALRESVDFAPAVQALVDLCESKSERQRALNAVYKQLTRQVISGEELLVFRTHAASAFAPLQVLKILERMRKKRKDLWHVWSALVQQLLEMKRSSDALRVAKKAAMRFPLVPRIQQDLADVYRSLDRLDDAAKAIKRALAVDSRNGDALRDLADVHRRLGQMTKAQTDLERAIESEPRNVTHRGTLAELLWTMGKRTDALRIMNDALQRDPLYQWGWHQLGIWADTSRRPELVLDPIKQISRLRRESPKVYLQQAIILRGFPSEHEACLDAINSAIRLDPRNVDAHDLRAQLLADRGQFEQAIASCRPNIYAGRRPAALQIREAIIESLRGNQQLAIQQMERIVKQDSNSTYAWSKIAEWHREHGDPEVYQKAARQLCRLAPNQGSSWGYLADSCLMMDDRQEAKQHLHTAIELDPSYTYGAWQLIEIEAEDGQFDTALEILSLAAPHLPHDSRLAQEVRLSLVSGKTKKAFKAFRSLCRLPLETTEEIFIAVDALLRDGHARHVKERLMREIERSEKSGPLCAVLVEVLAREGDLSAIQHLETMLPRVDDSWRYFASTYARILAEARARTKFDDFLRARRDVLHEHPDTWSAIGWGLNDLGRYQEVCRWMDDWRDRRDRRELKPAMFAPLVLARLELKQYETAMAIADDALQIPKDDAVEHLRVLAAAAAVARRDAARAGEYLSNLSPGLLNPYYRALFEAIRFSTGLVLAEDSSASWSETLGTWRRLVAQLRESWNGDAISRRIVTHCEAILAERFAGIFGRLSAEVRVKLAAVQGRRLVGS